jgi:hypothetical protein
MFVEKGYAINFIRKSRFSRYEVIEQESLLYVFISQLPYSMMNNDLPNTYEDYRTQQWFPKNAKITEVSYSR